MPDWAQKIDRLNPLMYFIRIMRMVLLKGSAFADISRDLYSLGIFAVIMSSLAVRRYRKVA
jgi:ABC-2 type transport system permease protein